MNIEFHTSTKSVTWITYIFFNAWTKKRLKKKRKEHDWKQIKIARRKEKPRKRVIKQNEILQKNFLPLSIETFHGKSSIGVFLFHPEVGLYSYSITVGTTSFLRYSCKQQFLSSLVLLCIYLHIHIFCWFVTPVTVGMSDSVISLFVKRNGTKVSNGCSKGDDKNKCWGHRLTR